MLFSRCSVPLSQEPTARKRIGEVATEQEVLMKKSLIALAAAGALAIGTVSVPQKAEAHAWWVVPSIVLGAAVVGGAAIASSRAHAGPYGYYEPGPRAQVRGTVHVAPTRGCYLQEYPALFGGYRLVEVCR
jgi:hypothetical protein